MKKSLQVNQGDCRVRYKIQKKLLLDKIKYQKLKNINKYQKLKNINKYQKLTARKFTFTI